MDVIHLKHNFNIEYPVGDYISTWVGVAKMYADKIYECNLMCLPIQIFCRGSSGAILSALVSSNIEVDRIVHIKKEGETSHGPDKPIVISSNYFNVIVDDFISSGSTILNILDAYPRIIFDLCIVASGNLNIKNSRIKTLITN